MKLFFRIALLGAIFTFLFAVNAFADTKTVSLSSAITGNGKVNRYEITLVAKASPVPSPNYKKLSTSTTTTEKYEVYVEGNANSLIRGVQVFSYDMKSIKLDFYDQGYLIDQQNIETDGGLLSERYSIPTHSNTVIIKVKPFKDGVTAVFNLSQIQYKIDTMEAANNTISYTAIESFMKDAEMLSFQKVFGKSTVTSLMDESQYNRATGGLLYVSTHSGGGSIYTDSGSGIIVNSLFDNQSNTNWILQKSCYVVNLDSALDWRNYFTTNTNHLVKGVFGVSGAYNALPLSKNYKDFAKKRALLSVTMNENAYKFNQTCASPSNDINRINNDTLAYTTVLINEKNIFDSMFEITDSNSTPSRYRLYRFQRTYGTVNITPESLGLVNVDWSKNTTTNKYTVVYSFTTDNQILNIKIEKDSLEAGSNLTEIKNNEIKYLANYLNNLDVTAFDALMKKSEGPVGYGFRMSDVLAEINELKNQSSPNYNLGAYKQWILHWLTLVDGENTDDKNIAQVPLVQSIVCDQDGYPEVEYAVISLQSGTYKYETTNGAIKWNREYLKDHKIGNGVPLK